MKSDNKLKKIADGFRSGNRAVITAAFTFIVFSVLTVIQIILIVTTPEGGSFDHIAVVIVDVVIAVGSIVFLFIRSDSPKEGVSGESGESDRVSQTVRQKSGALSIDGEDVQRRRSDGGDIQRRRSDGGDVQRRRSDGGDIQRRRPDGGDVQRRRPDGGDVQRRRPDGGDVQRRRPDDGEVQRRRPDGGDIQRRRPDGRQDFSSRDTDNRRG